MTLTIVRLYHDLLGTYGDQGNAEVLCHRARARNIEVELVEVTPGEPTPRSASPVLNSHSVDSWNFVGFDYGSPHHGVLPKAHPVPWSRTN